MKKCPFCAEDILDAAIKCKHCHEFLTQPSPFGDCDTCNAPLDDISDFCPKCGVMQSSPPSTKSERHEETGNRLKCPECSSTQITAQKKGFGLGKSAAGGLLLGPLGLLGGFVDSGSIIVSCLNCGHSWNAGDSPGKQYWL